MRKTTRTLASAAAVGAAFALAGPVLAARRFRSEKRDPIVWGPGAAETVLLKNAEVVDVLTGTVMHKRGIVMKGGRIEDVLTEKKAAALKGAKVLDAAGSYVIPGLINAHCHMILTSNLNLSPDTLASTARQVERHFEECVIHGVTTVRDAGAPPLLIRRYMDRIEREELLGPRVLSAGSFINAPGGYPSDYLKLPVFLEAKWGPFVRQVRTPQEARDAVKSNLEWGCNFIKIAMDDHSLFVGQKQLPVLDDDVLQALVDEAHDHGLKVSAHHRFRNGFVRGTRFGLDGMEHISSDEVLDDADVEAFVSGDRFIVPTVQVGWALSGFSHGDPYLDQPQVQRALSNRLEVVKTIYPSLCEPPVYRALLEYEKCYRDPDYIERRHLMYTLDSKIFTKALVIGEENLNKLYHAGALIGCGNDGGVPQIFAGILGIEMVVMESGTDLKPLDVLQAATINNARILGVEEELGTVARGKLADLVLLPGNPLDNMENVLYPNAVFKEGKLVYTTHRPELGVSP